MALVMSVPIRISRRAGYKQTDRTNELTVEVVDMLANIKPVKSMNRYGPLYESFQRSIGKLQKSLNTREISRQALIQGGDAFLAITVAGIIYVVYTVWQTPISELVVTAVLFLKVVSNFTKLQRWLQQTVQVESAYERLTQLVARAESQKEELSGKVTPNLNSEIRFENVNFFHGEKQVLKAVNLFVPPRGITVLKGPSGSGKTTIVDLLIGLHRPTSGHILVGATPLSQIDLLNLRSIINRPNRIGLQPKGILTH